MSSYRDKINTGVSLYYSFNNQMKRSFEIKKPKQILGTPLPKGITSEYIKRSKPRRSYSMKKHKLKTTSLPTTKYMSPRYVKPNIKFRSKHKRSYDVKRQSIQGSAPGRMTYTPPPVKSKSKSPTRSKSKNPSPVRSKSKSTSPVKSKSKSPSPVRSPVKSKSKSLANNTPYTPQNTNIWYDKQVKNQVQPRFIGVQLKYPRWAYKIDKRAFVLKKNTTTKKRISEFKKL